MDRNPFVTRNGQAVDTVSRIHMVKEFSRQQCEDAIKYVGLQSTVQAAVNRRMKQLAKLGQ